MKKKSLPKIFRKTYSENSLKRKILNKIYIPDDKAFVRSFFYEVEPVVKALPDKTEETSEEENAAVSETEVTATEQETSAKPKKVRKPKVRYAIPADAEISKKEMAKLSLIAKEIKKQKGRVKWVPAVAVFAFLFTVCVLFTTFKNRIIKNVIVETCESIFKARCDIDYVNFRLFGASFRMGGLQIANKKEPMKNLVEVEKIVLDFDLTQLLRLRFVTDEISILGVETNTDRTYSGDISAKLAAKLAKKQAKKAKQANESAFMKSIRKRTDGAIASVKYSITNLIDSYNPKSVLEKSLNEMTTLEVGKDIEVQVKALAEKWMEKPGEVSEKIKAATEAGEKVLKYDYKALKDNPAQLTQAINNINDAYKQAQNLREETELIIKDVQTDSESILKMIEALDTSINHDKDIVANVIDRYTSINLNTGKAFISGTLNNAGYQLLGKYYPTVVQVVNYLVELKNTNKAKGKKTEKEIMKSMLGSRSAGRNVYFRKNPPKFWIKKISASGKLGTDFAFTARHISSNMDQAGVPASCEGNISIGNVLHSASLVIDCRSYSNDPLINMDYDCSNLPLSLLASAEVPGMPSLNATSKFGGNIKIYEDEGFSLGGFGSFENMRLTANSFEPEYVFNCYSNVLNRIDAMEFSATAGYTVSNGVEIKLDTDIDDRFIAALLEELKVQLMLLKVEAEKVLFEKINQYTNGALGEINSFEDVKAKLSEFADTAKSLEKILENKKKEFENYINNKVEEVKEEVEEAVDKKVEETKMNAVQKAMTSTTNLLNGLRK